MEGYVGRKNIYFLLHQTYENIYSLYIKPMQVILRVLKKINIIWSINSDKIKNFVQTKQGSVIKTMKFHKPSQFKPLILKK